ncbi:class I SAM-dependent methyltransferase [Curtobacterium citreum]|uniref:Class I SAM-dependent methyltransferase n=1 Tax=Curtobacterium citreum TaxID=2036 RepID=A0ABT2HFB1_9MICO|nr:class I SAM-dependent methyltransferase [Curtobacterium citreum]MCS6521842.1 class I SAM-dependent methyltransferase [Curtobacterium citreum]TQJ27233.1 2-polyprenyl-3-methyl-5-hydroxy-6-metoxy-1,4-benzoquinol methylase [Curtobacterium citreum]
MSNTDHVTVDWDAARDTNRANWDDRVPIQEGAYDVAALDDPAHRSDVVRDDLPVLSRWLPSGSLDGLDVCHLQCHIGTDTVSLAREGARVTGVDFSAPALASGAALAERLGLDVTWVETDVLDARAAVVGDFDVVYTSIGTICWLADLDRWAAQVAALLRPGGVFFIRDGHPALYALDEGAPELVTRYRYFPDGTAQQWEDAGTYAGEGTVANTRTYEWPHPLSEVVNALLGAGLRLRLLDEGRALPWRFSPRMVEDGHGSWVWPAEDRDRLPTTFTVVATKD